MTTHIMTSYWVSDVLKNLNIEFSDSLKDGNEQKCFIIIQHIILTLLSLHLIINLNSRKKQFINFDVIMTSLWLHFDVNLQWIDSQVICLVNTNTCMCQIWFKLVKWLRSQVWYLWRYETSRWRKVSLLVNNSY